MTHPDPEAAEIARVRAKCLHSKKYSPTFYCTVWCQVHHGPGPECALLEERIALFAQSPEPSS